MRAPLDVTVLRSGIPDTLPGRSVDLGEGGVAAMLAGELQPGESVGVEIRLPATGDSFRMRALVRHHDKLRSGMEFIGLTPQQQAAIRECVRAIGADEELKQAASKKKSATKGEVEVRGKDAAEAEKGRENFNGSQPPASGPEGFDAAPQPAPARRRRGASWAVLLLSIAILGSVLWWRWNRGWEELEAGLDNDRASESIHPQANIPAEVMEKRITHRVDPEYPAAARPLKLQGAIVLEVVVGADGKVVDLHAQNGPEVLARAAVDALRWWRFEPYLIDGKPAVVETTVAVEFKP